MSGYTVLPQSWSPGLTQARMSSGGRLGRTSLIQDKLAQPSQSTLSKTSVFWKEESNLCARRNSQIGASTSYSTRPAPEITRDLTVAAQNASFVDAELLINSMGREGLEVSANALHSLIFAYAKAGRSLSAYKTLRAMRQAGIEPIAESYAVTIHSCMDTELRVKTEEPLLLSGKTEVIEDSDVLDVSIEPKGELEALYEDEQSIPAADRVFNWLMNAPVDRQPGWACYLEGLVLQGSREADVKSQLAFIEEIEEHLANGRIEGWYPDSGMYVDIFKLMCNDPKKAVIAEQMMWEDLVTRDGVRAEIEHYNCILRAEAVFAGIHTAQKTVEEMMEGKMGKHIRPNTATFNAMLEGCISERIQGMSYANEDFEEMVAQMVTIGLKMDKRTHALLTVFYMLEQDVDKVLYELYEGELLAAEGRATEEFTDLWLELLIRFLLREQCVLEVMRLLISVHSDERELPEKLCAVDDNGHTFATWWLSGFLVGQFHQRKTPELQQVSLDVEEEEESEEVVEEGQNLDELTLNRDKTAINPNSMVPIAPRLMSVDDLRTELDAKGLSLAGNKTELARRTNMSRGNEPMTIKELLHRRKADVAAKRVKKEEKEGESILEEGQQLMQKYVETIDHGVITNRYLETYIYDENAEVNRELDEDFENLYAQNLPPDVTELMKHYRQAYNTRELNDLYQLQTQVWNTHDPEFVKLNPYFHGRPGFGNRMTWPAWGNGGRLALVMLQTSEQLGLIPSANDYFQICEACVQEEDDVTGIALLEKFGPSIHSIDEQSATWLCTRILLLCMNKERLNNAASVADFMIESGLEIPGEYGDGLSLILRAAYEEQEADNSEQVVKKLGSILKEGQMIGVEEEEEYDRTGVNTRLS